MPHYLAHRAWRRQQQKPKSRFIANTDIVVPQLRVIDEDGNMLGVLDTPAALKLAKERGYDLIQVDPQGNPPVAKFLDFGQLKYEEQKRLKKQKAALKEVVIKGIRLTLRIGQHDLETRLDQARGFLEEGHKIQITMQLRGRENAHQDLARQIILKFIADLGPGVVVEQPIARQMRELQTIVRKQ